ncbi:MAG: hypothetical protein ACK4J0_00425 [Candidatus Anstonellaceae archaeon]
MKKAIFIFVLLLFLLTGCIYIETHEYFYSNGKSKTLLQIKYQNLVNVLEQANLKTPENISWTKFIERTCLDLANKTNFSSSCHTSQDWLIIEGMRLQSQGYVFSSYNAFPFTIYEIKIFTLPLPPLETLGLEEKIKIPKNNSFSSDQKYLNELLAAGIKYNYVVLVPGEIIDHNHGKVISNTLVVNPFDVAFSDQKFIYIKSRELNFEQLINLILIFLGLFLFFDLVVFWALKEWAKRSDEAEQEKRRELALKAKKIFEKSKSNQDSITFPSISEKKKL